MALHSPRNLSDKKYIARDTVPHERASDNLRSSYIRRGVSGRLRQAFRHECINTKQHRTKEHKLCEDAHGLDEGLAACALGSGQVNRLDVCRGKLWERPR